MRQFHIALVGALMVTALALILDAALAFAVWASVPGTGRLRKFGRMPQPFLDDEILLESQGRTRAPATAAGTSESRYGRGDPSLTVEG